jgi:hypothetical protein
MEVDLRPLIAELRKRETVMPAGGWEKAFLTKAAWLKACV